jgi:hypothetical protein
LKEIETLVGDIYELFEGDFSPDPKEVEAFGQRLAQIISNRIGEERGPPRLRLSNLGTQCGRKLWYSINTPEKAEKLSAPTRIKFLYGDIAEALLLFLAGQAGHDVRGTQDRIEINGVVGHRDAVIDGRLVDVKSASSYSYRKFENHELEHDDPFGYLTQLNSYLYGSVGDGIVKDENYASFLAIDKQLGKITLDTYRKDGVQYNKVIDEKRAIINAKEPPERVYSDVAEGASGNRKLGVACSYCAFKRTCWPGLRSFAYSNGPVFLTKVVREPKVPEFNEKEEN